MMTDAPVPHAPVAAPTSTMHTNIEAVLRHVLRRVDADRASIPSVRAALAAAGIHASDAWVADWLERAREVRKTEMAALAATKEG